MDIIHKLKRAFAVIATVTLLVTNASIAIAQTFNDVGTDAWYFDYVEQLVDEGVFDVADNFRPNVSLNRAELVKIVITAIDGLAGYEAPSTPTFDDVAVDAWYYDYVEAAVQLDIVQGYTDAAGNLTGMFGPGDTVNRAAATKILVNAFSVPTTLQPASNFPDVLAGAWFYDYVTTAYNQSILDGYANGYFGPADPVTRAQVAKLVVNSQDPIARVAAEGEGEGEGEGEVTPPPVASVGDLEVSLNDSTSRSSTVPMNASSVDLVSWDFTAADDDVVISNLAVTRGGVGTVTDWEELFLYEGVNRLTTSRTLNSDTNVATFPVNFTVEAGTTRTFRLVGRVAASGTANSNNQHYFYLASAGALTANAQSVAGDFPVAGNTFTIGGVSVNTLTVSVGTAIAQPLVGSSNVELVAFRTQAGGNNDVAVHNITLTQNGTLSTSRLTNLRLLRGNDEVATADGFDSERVTFVLDTPYVIPEGQTKNWYVRGDINGGRSSDTLQLYMDETSDITAIDQQYGAGAAITNTFNAGTTAGTDSTAISLKGGKFTVTDNGPSATQVASNITNVELLNYSVTTDRDLTVRDATVTVTITDGTATPDIDTTAAFPAHDATAIAASGTNYDVTADTVAANLTASTLVAGDMVTIVSGTTTYYARVVSNDGTTDVAGGLIVASASTLTGVTGTITEVNPYTYLENLRVIDLDSGATLQGPLSTVNQGTASAATNTVYRRTFTEDYELTAGETRHLSIQVDTDQYAVAGYQVTATVSYSTSSAAGVTATAATGYVKDFAANEDVAVADIVGDGLTGKPMSIAANSLALGLASSPNPTNTTYIKGQTGVESLGVNFTAGDAGDITIKKLTFRTVADDDGTFDTTTGDLEAKNIVASIALYDGNDLIADHEGLTLSDSLAAGFTAGTDYDTTEFEGLNVVVPAGSTKTLTVRMNIQSSIAATRYAAVYLVSTDIVAEDKDANNITASGGTINGASGNTHSRLVTIEIAGTLVGSQQSSPQASLVVAGATQQLVAQYEFASSKEAWNIQELTVMNDSTGAFATAVDTSAVKKVWIEYPDVNGVLQTAGQSLASGVANFSGLNPTMYVPKDDVAIVKVYADVQSTSYGQTLSGLSFRLGLQDNNADNADGTFRAVGAASGSSEYNPTITGEASIYKHYVRFSVPTITKDGGDEGLTDGDKDLYRLKVTADPARGIEVKRIVFRVSTSFNAVADTLTNFRIREGVSGSDMETTAASIVARALNGTAAADVHRNTTDFDTIDATDDGVDEGYVLVDFVDARTIAAGASKTFVLKANVSGANNTSDRISAYVDDDTVFAGTMGAGTVAKAPACYYLIDPLATAIDAYVLVDLDCDGTADGSDDDPWAPTTSEPRLDVSGIGNGTTGVTAEAMDYAAQVGQASGTLVRGQLAVMDPDIAVDDDHYFWFDEDDDGVLDAGEITLSAHTTVGDVLALDAASAPGLQTKVAGATAGTFDYAYVTMASPFMLYSPAAGRALLVLEDDNGTRSYTAGEIGINVLGTAADITGSDIVYIGGGSLGNFIWTDKSSTSPAHSENTGDWTNGYLVDTLTSPAKVMSY